jgi:hypothetical protein
MLAMIAMSSSVVGQGGSCDTGSAGGNGCAAGGCGTGTAAFGFPSAGCNQCGGGAVHGCLHHLHQGLETYKADHRLNRARNSAWPLPFSCWDREHYYAIFNQQYAIGNQVAHTLTSEYFHPESNELNRAGELRVAWIMQNAPQADKQIFLYEDETGPTMDQRIASVREFTDRYYAHLGNAAIVKSQLLPHQIPATFQATYLRQYSQGQPDPVIPVQVGETVISSVGN